VGPLSDSDVLGVSLPLKLLLADDLFGDPGVPPLEDEPDPGIKQGLHRGLGVAIATVEADHELQVSLLEDGPGRTEEISQPRRTDDVARIQVGGDCLRLAAWSTCQSSRELVTTGTSPPGEVALLGKFELLAGHPQPGLVEVDDHPCG
jgi:hypothetical protein